MSFLIPELYIILCLNIVSIFFMLICSVTAYKIIRFWDIDNYAESQYALEKKSFLVSIIVKYLVIIKIPLFFLFIYANDKLSNVLTGAMCAAGAVNAVIYGKYLFYASILDIYVFTIWIIIHHYDTKSEKMPFMKIKSAMIFLMLFGLCIETALFILNFSKLDPTVPVSCCNVIYSSGSFIDNISQRTSLIFLTASLIIVFLTSGRHYLLMISANIIYFAASAAALIRLTCVYIYELPTHHCPFCMLQSGYHYVGYIFYILLFLGTVSGIGGGVMQKISGKRKFFLIHSSLILNTLYYLLSIAYPISYYMRNHTWL